MKSRVRAVVLACVACTLAIQALPAAVNDTMDVHEQNAFSITGHVRHPGKYELIDDITVGQAIAIAGGLTSRGSMERIRIARTMDGKRVDLAASGQDPVLPNDTITVR